MFGPYTTQRKRIIRLIASEPGAGSLFDESKYEISGSDVADAGISSHAGELGSSARVAMNSGRRFSLFGISLALAFAAVGSQTVGAEPVPRRLLYAVNQAGPDRGAVAVYDIDDGHRLLRTIATVPEVADPKGIAASAATGQLFVAYRNGRGAGMIYCLNLADDRIHWNRVIDPGVDRLAISPDGALLYVPTWEGNTADFINIIDAATGDVWRRVHFSHRSHDAQYPLSGPLFQETKADDGSGAYLYMIDPQSYAVSRSGPYADVLGPYAADGASRYVVHNVSHLWCMQVGDLQSGRIVTASLSEHPDGDPELLHGIGWTPDEREVWLVGAAWDPVVYVWDMADPMAPRLQQKLPLRSGHGSHWLTFTIAGDYSYAAPNKLSADPTEVFDVRSHTSVGTIGSSEDMIEIDFVDSKITRVGDQYGVGRK
jgi:hypothetical protein